jgi:heme/copper-type cytochrome/quinol oxidase subunit 3
MPPVPELLVSSACATDEIISVNEKSIFSTAAMVVSTFIYTVIYSILQVLRYQKRFAVAGFRAIVNNTETHPNNPPMSC